MVVKLEVRAGEQLLPAAVHVWMMFGPVTMTDDLEKMMSLEFQ